MDLTNSRNIIFDYAGLAEKHKVHIGELIDGYTAILNGGDLSSDVARKLRKELNMYFFELYKAIFFATLKEENRIPTEIFMFLYFGYIDEKLAGKENAEVLYDMANNMGMDEKMHIFPLYQWLRLIYMGKKDPSVNEFSLDYAGYLRDEKKQGNITPQEEISLFRNPEKRVEFEINNMVKNADRMMSGSASSFCPFFNSQAVYKPLDQMLHEFESIHKTFDVVRMIDYSLFYRETVYTNPEHGVEKEFIQVEVLPDVILMPVVGERSAMWQEITGAKRTTPGRFIMPIFESEELTKTIIKLCGEFRWELCKRIQGARWNDLSERSLTSDYCDYIDTYKRNRELSPEAKERIKNSMAKHRNSYKEMFVEDYIQYISYESQGSLRLNKIARNAVFTYCPFSNMIRKNLAANPQYAKLIELYNNRNGHKKHLFEISLSRIEKAGHKIPTELSMYYAFLGM